jgi:phospholipase/carboxylesterase
VLERPAIIGDGEGVAVNDCLPCVEVPAAGEATASVIWLHGLGASGHDFEPVVPQLGMDHARFVFPHAPARPVTINMGMVMPSWYDILSMDRSAAVREDMGQVAESTADVEALIEREKSRGVSAERIVLAGFSQGGAIALHVGPRHSEALAGIMVLSAYQLAPTTFADEAHSANASTDLLFCHGSLDPMVPMLGGRTAYDRPATWHDYPMGHQVCLEELDHIGAWLRQRLPC